MYLGKADVNTYDKGIDREFLVSNGAGSYGSSTVAGANTRSEHGLLVIRAHDSAQHTVLVSKVEETLYAHNKKYQLSTNRYKDLIYPDGYRYIQEYQGSPIPSLLFVVHSIFLKKSIFMPQNGMSTIIKYELLASPEPIRMDLRPLLAHRVCTDIKQCPEKSTDFQAVVTSSGVISINGCNYTSNVSFANSGNVVEWHSKSLWFENLVYERDGLPDNPVVDNLWSPGYGAVNMKQGDVVYVVLSEQPLAYSFDELESLETESLNSMKAFVKDAPIESRFSAIQDMVQSSCHLVADNKGKAPAIFSGFPSVEQRARDTFISLPGLTLATGRIDTARAILDNWLALSVESDGVVPSYIDYNEVPGFGEIDSGLWFLYAADKYTTINSDYAKVNYQALKRIIEKYIDGGKCFGVVMDPGTKLLKHFDRENTSHWMSGDVKGEPLVDRKGYLVEINALWYNALCFMKQAAAASSDTEGVSRFDSLASESKSSFEKIFWNADSKYLFDWVDPITNEKDTAIRPNAILAISLPNVVLDEDKGREVFATCWNELYTTYGLRTLDPHHDKFKGRAEGRPDQKKKARLRGMAWPWLLGHFVTAFMRYNPGSYDMGWSFMRPFISHTRRGCLGGVAEYFDGVMPYMPSGDVLSAMSLGELLRVMHEDLGNK